jgi:hypothetical protein
MRQEPPVERFVGLYDRRLHGNDAQITTCKYLSGILGHYRKKHVNPDLIRNSGKRRRRGLHPSSGPSLNPLPRG